MLEVEEETAGGVRLIFVGLAGAVLRAHSLVWLAEVAVALLAQEALQQVLLRLLITA